METPAIKLSNVHLSLGRAINKVQVLKNIHLEVEKAQKLAIIGPSGSGKTSLIMVIAGLESPQSGKIEINGADISHMTENQLASFRQKHIGIIFQQFHLIPTMTALENVAVPLELSEQPQDASELAKTALQEVGLAHRLTHYPAELSGGEQQRVAIARAIVTRPSLLLADEPTGNLDQHTGDEIVKLLFSLQAHYQTTLILITHDTKLAAQCERIIKLKDGEIAQS